MINNAACTETPQQRFIPFRDKLIEVSESFQRATVTTLQINLGKLCNQACLHCHVEAGPHQLTENMSAKTVLRLMELIENSQDLKTIDLTGGAPELNPHFKDLVKFVRARNITLIDRCNLTVLFEPGQEETAQFLARENVQIVASLPCYSFKNVDKQRGNGVFEKSINALKLLNKLGYGHPHSGLELNLVYNPLGTSLPPSQEKLESQYKQELEDNFGIVFNRLFTITNMPIKRFLNDLKRQGLLQDYMDLLLQNFNPASLSNVMCKSLVSVSWEGSLFDCDFNQMTRLKMLNSKLRNIWDIKSLDELNQTAIAVNNHCYGCTAGAGSSCQGSLI